MSRLSISRAWDETRGHLARDGRLMAMVALALIALPSAISTLVDPTPRFLTDRSVAAGLFASLMSLIGLVGQLAIIRLALGPSVSVGGAIGHAARRTFYYVAALLMLLIALFVLAIPLGVVLAAMGVSLEQGAPRPSASVWIPMLIFLAVILYFAARMLLTSSVASAESVGPLRILRRSWALTRGHVGKLLGFLLIFLVAIFVVLGTASVMLGLLVSTLFGEVEPMSVAALVTGLVQGLIGAAATTIFAVMLARIYVQLAGPAGDPQVSVPSSGT